MVTAQTLHDVQQADAPMQLAFRMQASLLEATDHLIPEGALYRVLNIEPSPYIAQKDGFAYKVTASAIEFTEVNAPLCAAYFNEWPTDFSQKFMERFSFWIPASTDLGERVLDDHDHIDSRKTLEASLEKMTHQANYYAPFDPEKGDEVWHQEIANACLKRGDTTSKLSLVIRHLI